MNNILYSASIRYDLSEIICKFHIPLIITFEINTYRQYLYFVNNMVRVNSVRYRYLKSTMGCDIEGLIRQILDIIMIYDYLTYDDIKFFSGPLDFLAKVGGSVASLLSQVHRLQYTLQLHSCIGS